MTRVKIDRNRAKGIAGAYRGAAAHPAAPTAPEQHTQAVSQADQVTVSNKARQVSGLTAQLSSLPEVRTEQIARLKAQLSAGNYRVDSRKLADRLLKARVLDE